MNGIEIYHKVIEYRDKHEMDFEHTEEYDLILQIYTRCQQMEQYIGAIMVDNYTTIAHNGAISMLKVKCEQMEAELKKQQHLTEVFFDEELWKELGYDV